MHLRISSVAPSAPPHIPPDIKNAYKHIIIIIIIIVGISYINNNIENEKNETGKRDALLYIRKEKKTEFGLCSRWCSVSIQPSSAAALNQKSKSIRTMAVA